MCPKKNLVIMRQETSFFQMADEATKRKIICRTKEQNLMPARKPECPKEMS